MIDKVDVIVPTKNNEDTIEKCLEAIKKYLPYNNIIIIDDSTDKTPEIAKNLGVVVHTETASLGQKRYLQGKLSTTEWIASIDSDIFVYSNWWSTMSQNIKDDVGIISACVEGSIIEYLPAYDHFTKWKSLKSYNKTNKCATAGNNLIRKDLLMSCTCLNKVRFAEDAVLIEHIMDKGYNCALNKNITGFHYQRDPISHIKTSYRRMGEEYIHRKDYIKAFANILAQPFFITYDWLTYNFYTKKMNFDLYKFLIKLYFEMLKGIF